MATQNMIQISTTDMELLLLRMVIWNIYCIGKSIRSEAWRKGDPWREGFRSNNLELCGAQRWKPLGNSVW